MHHFTSCRAGLSVTWSSLAVSWRTGRKEKPHAGSIRNDTAGADVYGQERPLAVRDSFLAATALSRGLVLVSRNKTDFAGTGVKLFNPWTT
jgi:predicted nucleic acid-binding protein